MSSPSVQLIEGGETALNLYAGLLLYRSADGSRVYATAHEILDHPIVSGAKLLGPGQAASKEALADFAADVATATAYKGLVPENLLYTAPNMIAWWAPSCRRRVWFKSEEKSIGDASAEVLHPPLIFVATANNWYVFAVQTTDRPQARTALYKAPYFNVWDGGRICTGNVDLPDAIGPESIRAYEDAFFRSRFTHPNEKRLVRYKGGAVALWRDQLQHPETDLLCSGVLASCKETFEHAINRILTRGN